MEDLSVDIVVVLESRWRVGTGTSRSGAVDDEMWRAGGGDGAVTIPASHLKRRLRERAEWLAGLRGLRHCKGRLASVQQDVDVAGRTRDQTVTRGCDASESDPCVVCRIFGSPRVEPGWQFGPALPETPEVAGQSHRSAHNALDPWARRVGEDLLFVVEAGWPTQLRARAKRLLGADGADELEEEVGLLVASVGALEAVGSRTRRGYGACRAWVEGSPAGRGHDEWVCWFLDHRWKA